MSLRVVVEVTPKKAFASAIDWPGWSRGAKTHELSLQALLDYAPRYAAVTKRGKVAFAPPKTLGGLDVVQRLDGDASTEFGIPAAHISADGEPITPAELKRQLALLEAAWKAFDAAARKAEGVSLRLGPRGGGRQVPKIIEHVSGADEGYLRALGTKPPADGTSILAVRRAFVAALTARATGQPLPDPNKVRKPWAPRYAIRRSAWHALDHAWEIEDRAG
jgi:hypothetical protein